MARELRLIVEADEGRHVGGAHAAIGRPLARRLPRRAVMGNVSRGLIFPRDVGRRPM